MKNQNISATNVAEFASEVALKFVRNFGENKIGPHKVSASGLKSAYFV